MKNKTIFWLWLSIAAAVTIGAALANIASSITPKEHIVSEMKRCLKGNEYVYMLNYAKTGWDVVVIGKGFVSLVRINNGPWAKSWEGIIITVTPDGNVINRSVNVIGAWKENDENPMGRAARYVPDNVAAVIVNKFLSGDFEMPNQYGLHDDISTLMPDIVRPIIERPEYSTTPGLGV